MRTISRDFRTLFATGALGVLTDGQLLELFLARGEDVAFAEIVRRHGPMVWGVCRRILCRHHDAEDAFQAVFLVLARKGESVSPRERLPHWLYGVAVRTSLRARTILSQRTERERQVAVMPEPPTHRPDPTDDLRAWLDHELSRLPEKYRIPIVLCDLEGESHKEAAGRLGWPIGTLSGRLSRARALLATRLNRHGGGLSAGTLAFVLAREAESAGLPASLAESTARLATGGAAAGRISAQVAALTESVLTAMVVSQVKTVIGGLLMACLVGLCLGMQVEKAGALESQAEPKRTESRGADRRERIAGEPVSPKADLEQLEGTWFGSVIGPGDNAHPADAVKIPPSVKLIVNGEHAFLRGPKFGRTVSFKAIEDTELTLKLDVAGGQRTIDLTCVGTNGEGSLTYHGIYELTKDQFIARLSLPGQDRPTAMGVTPRESQLLPVVKDLRVRGRRPAPAVTPRESQLLPVVKDLRVRGRRPAPAVTPRESQLVLVLRPANIQDDFRSASPSITPRTLLR